MCRGGGRGYYPQGFAQVIHRVMLTFLKRLTMRSRYERLLSKDLKHALARVDRLEIHLGSLTDQVEHLKARQEKLGTRLGGALGGRPRKGIAPPGPQQLPLDDIPRGDKAGLRAYFRINPPKSDREQLAGENDGQ